MLIFLLAFIVTLFKVPAEESYNDIDQIVEVINLAYQRQPFNRMDRVRITSAQLNELIANPSNQLFLLSTDNTICGTVFLRGSEISLFAIHPDFQGRGYGEQLLISAERQAFKNYDSVHLKVIPLFQEKLIDYYERMGYNFFGYEALAKEKLDRIQERYHDQVYALILEKKRPH